MLRAGSVCLAPLSRKRFVDERAQTRGEVRMTDWIRGDRFLLSLLKSRYGGNEDEALRAAVLDTTWFVAPEVVAQTEGLPVVNAIRLTSGERKNAPNADGTFVSDNFPPHYAFCSAIAERRDPKSTELCHIYGGRGEAREAFLYTNLANLCLMPACLAKLSSASYRVEALLKECSYVLYGFDPFRDTSRAKVTVRRDEIRCATAPKALLGRVLSDKREKRFHAAKCCGYLFDDRGRIARDDPWVRAMLGKQACAITLRSRSA